MTAPVTEAVFHAGERCLQRAVGVESQLAEHGQLLVREQMPAQHRAFFEQLPLVLVGGLDASGQPWATVWTGAPGFIASPDPATLRLSPHCAAGDPLAASWRPGAPIALLGLEAHTRRRNRANGRLRQVAGGNFEIAVAQSFGNCPKYIVPRRAEWVGAGKASPPSAAAAAEDLQVLGAALDPPARALLARTDTFFIASSSPQAAALDAPRAHGVDVSHRAGRPGFVQVQGTAAGVELVIPDYPGNRMFNTLGNLLLEPRAGLLLIDYAEGGLLWLTGLARIEQDAAAVAAVPGAQRLLHLQVTAGVAARGARGGLRWHHD